MAGRVTGSEQTHQPLTAVNAEALAGHHQPASAAVERIVLVAAMTEGLVLYSASALVQRLVGELDHMERIGDLDCVGEHRVEHRAIQRRQIQRRPPHLVAPAGRPDGEPCTARRNVLAGQHVEELPALHIDDLR